MSDAVDKCHVCGGLLDEEDLFCANCGTEVPRAEPVPVADGRASAADALSSNSFKCDGCGASMSYDAGAKTLRCPFCGNETLHAEPVRVALEARRVIPMKVARDEANQRLRNWLQSSFWRPSDLAVKAVIVKFTPVYVPYWRFSVDTHTYWTADSSQTPVGARGDWVPLTGEHRGTYDSLLVSASGALAPQELAQIQPFQFGESVPRDEVDLSGVTCEQFRVPRKYARPQAFSSFNELERQACQVYVPGRSRNVKVNVRFANMSSEPILLPVWILAYRYKGTIYRFLVNGQTGKSTGTAPTSMFKVGGAIGAALLLVAMLAVCAGLLAAVF